MTLLCRPSIFRYQLFRRRSDIRLDWTAADTLATGYNIYESTDGGETFNIADSVDGNTTSDLIQSPDAGTTPQFYVTATNASGESAPTGTLSLNVPQPPGDVTTTLSADGTSATIHWQASPTANGYYVTRVPDNGSTPTVLPEVTPGSATSTTDTGLHADRRRARHADGLRFAGQRRGQQAIRRREHHDRRRSDVCRRDGRQLS